MPVEGYTLQEGKEALQREGSSPSDALYCFETPYGSETVNLRVQRCDYPTGRVSDAASGSVPASLGYTSLSQDGIYSDEEDGEGLPDVEEALALFSECYDFWTPEDRNRFFLCMHDRFRGYDAPVGEVFDMEP